MVKTPLWRACRWLVLTLSTLCGVATVQAATDNAQGVAEVIITLSLENQSDLIFGDIGTSNAPGTVILSPDGSRITTGGTFINSNVSGGAAVFDVSGLPNAVYAISLPNSVVLTGASGNSMVVDNFTSLPANTGLTDPGGEQNLFVGGTLNVDSNQAVGSYSGQMSVTVVYN